MLSVKILQVGTGGTGAFFARTLAHSLVNYKPLVDNKVIIDWTLVDNDIIEEKNLLRQMFLGQDSVNTSKVNYTAKVINMITTAAESYYERNDPLNVFVNTEQVLIEDFGGLRTLVTELKGISRKRDPLIYNMQRGTQIKSITLIVSCVDNSYTRNLFERYIINEHLMGNVLDLFYLDMGVTADNRWKVQLMPASQVYLTKFTTVTYPDGMMSCAQRAEQGSVPQTTIANGLAGIHAAQLAMDLIDRHDKGWHGKYVEGDSYSARDFSKTSSMWVKTWKNLKAEDGTQG